MKARKTSGRPGKVARWVQAMGKTTGSAPKRRRRAVATLGRVIKFQPPRIFLAEGEYLIPFVHRNSADLRKLARALDGAIFYVKAVEPRPQSISGGYMVMVKLKRADAK